MIAFQEWYAFGGSILLSTKCTILQFNVRSGRPPISPFKNENHIFASCHTDLGSGTNWKYPKIVSQFLIFKITMPESYLQAESGAAGIQVPEPRWLSGTAADSTRPASQRS